MPDNPQPARYRQRPNEVDAIQWTGSNADALRAFAGIDFATIDPADRIDDLDCDAQLLVEASHWVGIKPGDWVLKFEGYFIAKDDAPFRAVWEPAAPVPDTTDPQPVNDMRELYAVQHAITDAGGTLTPAVHKAIDALREVWDAGLRHAQAVPAAPAAVPSAPADRAARTERYATAIRETDGWVLDDGQHMVAAVMAVADTEQTELRREHADRLEHLEGALARIRDRAEVVQVRVRRVAAGSPLEADIEAALAGEPPADLLRRVAAEAQQPETQAEVVHACPPDGSGLTPCCGRTPFELPRTGRMSSDPALVTCQAAAVSQPGNATDGPRTVCVCGHTKGEHLTVSGRLLCDACDPDSTDNLVCKEFEAL